LTNVTFRVADAENTGLSDASVDVVFSSGMLSYLRAPERAIAESYRLLSPGGVFGAREMAKQGDWYAGPHAEVRSLMLRAMIIGMQERGGDPYLGARLKGLLSEAGFVGVEGYPSYSSALSSPRRLLNTLAAELTNPSVLGTLAAAGIVTEAQRADLRRTFEIWAAADESVAAVADFKAWGFKLDGTA
jgi:SAM-dependent methyltransferase